MGKSHKGFTRRVAEKHRARVKNISASLKTISFAFIQKVLMPPHVAAVRRRNAFVKGSEMWYALDKEAEKWQMRAFEALNALDDCAAFEA